MVLHNLKLLCGIKARGMNILIFLKLLGRIILEVCIKMTEIMVCEIRCELLDEDNLSWIICVEIFTR